MTASCSHDDVQLLLSLAQQHGVSITEKMGEQICHYCRLLWAHNEQLNLTRHIDFPTFVARDLVDSVRLAEQLGPGERVLDVGSGGGVPGIVLAILRPDLEITLSESVRKKADALQQMAQELGLPVQVFPIRAEEVLLTERFQTLVSRAVGPLWKVLQWFEGRWGAMDRMLLIKGPNWVAERGEARHRGYMRTLELRRLVTYDMPGHDGQSVILSVWKK
ncbi:MAG: 16S rRNA (guanine(527)-N(7))-methyltransferase RsmG [Planctomycetota bacterium]|nr:16S rRNA (guanine(527)-N(7))-methyltransferase RsmG [Planctomycetota bacterium]MDA1180632.1 16S rRNA (guanine(527)-N(7))-methyltransferase RsmG [Planctomycetota bacterium]